MDDFFDVGDDNNNTTEATDAAATNDGGAAIALGMPNDNEDVFAGMGNGDDNNDATAATGGDDNAAANDAVDPTDEKQGNDEPTFLSVWQEQRRIELQKRRDKEVEEQRALQTQAEEDLNEFHSNRQRKIEGKKKENRDKEDGLREDLNSVFKHGTLWEQVGRLVNLQEVKNNDVESVDRMRNLLIHLKNVKQQ